MQSFAKGLSRVRIRRQSGSVATLGALWLMIAVICLATIDIGNVFWQKRELQKIADLAALAGASGPLSTFCDPSESSAARVSATSNGLLAGTLFSANVGKWTPSAVSGSSDGFSLTDKNSKEANACKVSAKKVVPFLFIFSFKDNLARSVDATAIAKQLPQLAKITIRSTLLNIDTNESILEPLLNGLLGSAVKIDAVGWKGLAGSDIDLLRYINLLSTNLKVGNYEELLKTDVSVEFLLKAMIDLLEQESTAHTQILVLENLLSAVKVKPVTVKLAELLNLSTGLSDAALKTGLNALDLASALVFLSNSKNAVDANITVPSLLSIVDAKINIRVIEPPQWAIGNPASDSIIAKTSQVRLGIVTNANLLGLAELKLMLFVDVGSGSANVEGFSCASPNKELRIGVASGALNLYTGKPYTRENTELKIIGVPVPIVLNLKVEKRIPSQKYSPVPSLNAEPMWRNFDLQENLGSLLLAGIVETVVNFLEPLEFLLKPVLTLVLSPLGALLDAVLGPLLGLLGVKLGQVDVGGQLNCAFQADLVY